MIDKAVFNRTVHFLRRQFTWSQTYRRVKKTAHIAHDIYQCGGCERFVGQTEKHIAELIAKYPEVEADRYSIEKCAVDHICPVGTLSGSLDEAYEKIFCDDSNLMVLCNSCHYVKTRVDLEEIKEKKKPSLLNMFNTRNDYE